jgi:hypothetical protein
MPAQLEKDKTPRFGDFQQLSECGLEGKRIDAMIPPAYLVHHSGEYPSRRVHDSIDRPPFDRV